MSQNKILYNFTNHKQDDYKDFFKAHGFTEVTPPIHPLITEDMSEEAILKAVKQALPEIKGNHFLVQGLSNVCFYANTLIIKHGGIPYYVLTKRIRDKKDRFVFSPISLRRYLKVNGDTI